MSPGDALPPPAITVAKPRVGQFATFGDTGDTVADWIKPGSAAGDGCGAPAGEARPLPVVSCHGLGAGSRAIRPARPDPDGAWPRQRLVMHYQECDELSTVYVPIP